MQNQITLLSQKFSFDKLTSQFPSSGSPFKKIFFQSELRSLEGGTAIFAVIAYPAWKATLGKWVVGTKIDGEDMEYKIKRMTKKLEKIKNISLTVLGR